MIAQPHPTVDFRGRSYSLDKCFEIGNSSRILPPAETLERVKPLFPRLGLTRLGNVTGLDRIGLPVTIAIRPNSYSLTQSSGKGTSLAAALASAAMESIELACAEQIAHERIRRSYRVLRGEVAALDLDEMYLSRHSLFHVDRPEEWVLGWDIANQEQVAVPYHSVTLDFRVLNDIACPASFTMDSNGLASGNHFLEALLAGLLEVIERDGVSCHSEAERHGRPKQRIQLAAVEDEAVHQLCRLLERAGLVPAVFDCTTDIGVPVFEAFVYDARSNMVPIAHGYGAHLKPATALLRALTEAVQARTLIISGSRDDLFRDVYSANRIRYRSLVDSVQTRQPETPMTYPDRSTSSFELDVLYILECLRRVGLKRAVVVDLSPPDAEISVLRVLVPGLEGYYYYGYNPRARARRFVETHCGRSREEIETAAAEPRQESTHLPAGGII